VYAWKGSKELFPVDVGKCVHLKGTILCLKRICNPVHIRNKFTPGKVVHLKGTIQIMEDLFL
jgi:hypothetical protein